MLEGTPFRGAIIAALIMSVSLAGCTGSSPPASSPTPPPVPAADGPKAPLLLEDAAGDAGVLPCSAATDLLRFRAAWGHEGVYLNYSFRDLSVVDGPASLGQGAQGQCFWSFSDFVAEIGNQSLVDSVYIDHNSNPMYVTGWRFYLHEDRTDLPAEVAGNEIRVVLPYALVGTPQAGDRIGDFRIQATSSLAGLGYDYQGGWAPDDASPCGCWLTY